MLESEVGYSRATLPEGLIRVGNRLGGRLGECFINVGKKAQGPEGITFAAAWDEEVAGFLKETYLDKKEEELRDVYKRQAEKTVGQRIPV